MDGLFILCICSQGTGKGAEQLRFLFPSEKGKMQTSALTAQNLGKPINSNVVMPRLKKSAQCSLTCWVISWDLTHESKLKEGGNGEVFVACSEAWRTRKRDYSKGHYPVKSEHTSTCQSMRIRAHLHHYMLTLHTYLLHISFHKEFLIKMGSCFLWNLVLHHTLLKLFKKKKKRKYGCYNSNSSNHIAGILTLDSNGALSKPCISDVR